MNICDRIVALGAVAQTAKIAHSIAVQAGALVPTPPFGFWKYFRSYARFKLAASYSNLTMARIARLRPSPAHLAGTVSFLSTGEES